MYPDYYWCTNCGTKAGFGSTAEGWKEKELCHEDRGGMLRCPYCGRPVRTHARA